MLGRSNSSRRWCRAERFAGALGGVRAADGAAAGHRWKSVAEGVEARPGGLTAEASAYGLGVKLLRVAWMAILLGFAVDALFLLVAIGFFENLPILRPLVADQLKNVSWPVIVCSGLALGQTISRIRCRQ